MKRRFLITDPEVVSVTADKFGTEEHLDWEIGVAPESEPDEDGRFIIASLHVYGTGGGGAVRVGAMLIPCSDMTFPSLEELREEEALETIYNIARLAFNAATALVDVHSNVPLKAPAPVLSFLVRAESDDKQNSADIDIVSEGSG